MSRWIALVLPAAFLCACPEKGDDSGEPIACDTMAVGSVNVSVVDAAGAAIAGATVTYSGGDFVDQPCEEYGGAYTCGWELAGEITVKAAATGFSPAEGSVTVEADVCHVIPQALTLTLASAS